MDPDNGDNLNWDFAPPDFSGEAFDPFADSATGVGDLTDAETKGHLTKWLGAFVEWVDKKP